MRRGRLRFTTRDDTAAYTAAVALDATTPRVLRISGDTISARGIAAAMTEASGVRHRLLWAGPVGVLRALIPIARRVAPDKPDPTFPAWQGMAYSYDMFSGRARPQPA